MTVTRIWLVALLVAVGGVFYINTSMRAIELGSPVLEPVGSLRVDNVRIVGVDSYQGCEDNTGYNLQPAQVGSLDYRPYTILSR